MSLCYCILCSLLLSCIPLLHSASATRLLHTQLRKLSIVSRASAERCRLLTVQNLACCCLCSTFSLSGSDVYILLIIFITIPLPGLRTGGFESATQVFLDLVCVDLCPIRIQNCTSLDYLWVTMLLLRLLGVVGGQLQLVLYQSFYK